MVAYPDYTNPVPAFPGYFCERCCIPDQAGIKYSCNNNDYNKDGAILIVLSGQEHLTWHGKRSA
jgi:hypothetical protein